MANNYPGNFLFWAGGNGDWFSGWTPNGLSVPDAGTDAAALQQDITITLNGTAFAQSLSMQGPGVGLSEHSATLDMSGGSLTISRGTPTGNINQTGGTIRFRNGLGVNDQVGQPPVTDFTHNNVAGASSTIFNLVQDQDSTILIDSGTLNLSGNASNVAGTIGGRGTLADPVAGYVKLVINGIATLGPTLQLNVSEFQVAGTNATATFNLDFNFSDTFLQGGQTTLNLNSHTVTLNGPTTLNGLINGLGTLVAAGTTAMQGVVVTGGAILKNTGTANQSVGINIGTGVLAGTILNDVGGTWNVTNDSGFTMTADGLFTNNGLFHKTGGVGEAVTGNGTFNSTGTVQVDTGSYHLFGQGTLGGTVTGAGKLQLSGNFTLANGLDIDIATFWNAGTNASMTLGGDMTYGGDFRLSGVNANIHLANHTFTLSGQSTLDGGILDAGTLRTTGTTDVSFVSVGPSALMQNDGTVTQAGGSQVQGTLNIGNGAAWQIINDSGINVFPGGIIHISGILEKIGGTGQSNVGGSGTIDIGTFGTLKVGSGVMRLDGALVNGGLIDAAGGKFEIFGPVTGTGSAIIEDLSTIAFRNSVAATRTVFFASSSRSTLELSSPGNFAGTLKGFNAGDVLRVHGNVLDADVVGSTLVVDMGGPTFNFALGSPTANGLTISIQNVISDISYATTSIFTGLRADRTVLTSLDANGQISGQVVDNVAPIDNPRTLLGYQNVQFANGTFALPHLQLIGGNMHVVGGNDNDNISGNNLNILLDGGNGNDTLNGGLGNDSYDGGAGNDTINFSNTSQTVNVNLSAASNQATGAQIGVDQIANVENVNGGSANDAIKGNALVNRLDGGAGNDALTGLGGNDVYLVDAAGDRAFEAVGEGTDAVITSVSFMLTAGQELESLSTSNAAATTAINLSGNEFNNQLFGNAGANTLNGMGGVDQMTGNGGNDTYYVDNAADRVFEAVGGGTDAVLASISFTLAAGQEIETLATTNAAGTGAINFVGNEFANRLFGNAGANTLNGGGGIDQMTGNGGNDVYNVDQAADRVFEAVGGGMDTVLASASFALSAGQEVETVATSNAAGTTAINFTGNELAQRLFGNAGNNMLNGGGGVDQMTGNGGNDVYNVDQAADKVFEAVGGGTADAVLASVSFTLGAGQEIETLATSNAAGSDAINLTGNELAQRLFGNAGNNILNGLGGVDQLFGNGGTDTLNGGAGNDVLDGGADTDTLTGGADNDQFKFVAGQANGDTVVDFAGNGAAAGDSLMFSGYGAGATFTNVDATHWQVNYNNGASHDVITFSNAANIHASDFTLV